MSDGNTYQALSLLQQAFDALEATADSDIEDFEDEQDEAEAVPAQYACRKIMEAMGLMKERGDVAPANIGAQLQLANKNMADMLEVLRMVDDNNREDGKAWRGSFVEEEVRRVVSRFI